MKCSFYTCLQVEPKPQAGLIKLPTGQQPGDCRPSAQSGSLYNADNPNQPIRIQVDSLDYR